MCVWVMEDVDMCYWQVIYSMLLSNGVFVLASWGMLLHC